MSETPANQYERPPFPFYQEEFADRQAPLSEEVIAYVESVFSTTTDQILDSASEDQLRRDDGAMFGLGQGSVVESVEVPTQEAGKVFMTVAKDGSGRVVQREVTLGWDNGHAGTTRYYITYNDDRPTVRRKDDSDNLPPGLDPEEARRSKAEAARIAKEMGYDDQPIGKREAKALRRYLRNEPQIEDDED